MDALLKKQEKDKKITTEMKFIDRTKLISSEFDRTMLFGNTFSHQKDVYK